MLRNEKGFTLIEIIAVLVILGILAAVAIPRYISMMDQSRIAAANGAIGEVKARCSSWYATKILEGVTADAPAVQTSVGATPDVGSDFVVGTSLGSGSTSVLINVTSVKGTAVTIPTATWILPTI